MTNGEGLPPKPRIAAELFSKVAPSGKSAPLPPHLRKPPTLEDVRSIAQDIARKEIVSVSNALAKKVHEVIAKHLSPVNQKFVELYNEVNKIIILTNTMQEHLQRKGVIVPEEFSVEIKKSAQEARTAYQAAMKAMQERIKVDTEEPSIDTPPILERNGHESEPETPAGVSSEHADHLSREVFDPNCVQCVETKPKAPEVSG
jgi:hypothetical protein